jgi:hypothetical protein
MEVSLRPEGLELSSLKESNFDFDCLTLLPISSNDEQRCISENICEIAHTPYTYTSHTIHTTL